MEELTADLNKVSLEIPDEGKSAPEPEPPESYTSNNKKEELLLQFSENFQRQFRQLYSDRKPLLLTPLNEYGVPKFMCSTVRPTYLQYKELYEYDSCAEFVSDYLNYEPLKIPNEMPSSLVSPTLVLREQKGNCFDYAILLTSLLIGVGYDAYCVCGYASQDVCLLNLGRDVCPSLKESDEVKDEEVQSVQNRYTVRPLRDFTSAFERRQVAKEKARLEKEVQKRKEEAAARLTEAEAPPPDKYHGLRIHCWVLVLMGKRDVGHNFFIEPTTGMSHPLDWEHYHGVEVLWNHRNYWVNMQDCSEGVQRMSYDLGDAAIWEFFFPNVDKPMLVIPGEDLQLRQEDSDETKASDLKEDFQLPPSWVLPLYVSSRDLESRCPKGSKTVLYYRAKQEKFAEYLNQDGLVSKFTIYSDTARRNKTEVRYTFKHRQDLLQTRVEKVQSGESCESFDPGRLRSLKTHIHYDSNPLRAGNRTLEFYAYARVDGLAKRVMTPTEMIEHYVERSDFLYYRHVTYEKVSKKHNMSEDRIKPRQIVKVVEKFHPNPALHPNSDVAERSFLLCENRIVVVYQLEEGRNTASSREFVVPPLNPEQAVIMTFDPDNISSYQVDPYLKQPKNHTMFEQLEALIQAREDTVDLIRQSENEIQSLLNARAQEEQNTLLDISVYDVVRNETARKHRQELEQKLAEEEKIRREKEKDYLAPFLARIGDPDVLDKDQMVEVAQDCLKDLRTRLVDMANIIQGRFEQETDKLQKKQAWYKSMQGSLTKEEEGDYVTFCNDTMFTIHILEQRLNRHKLSAPQKYMNLERRLKEDPRVCYIYK